MSDYNTVRAFWVPHIRDPARPTTEEIAAGIELSGPGADGPYTITVNRGGPVATVVSVDDVDTATAALQDMAVGETLTIHRIR